MRSYQAFLRSRYCSKFILPQVFLLHAWLGFTALQAIAEGNNVTQRSRVFDPTASSQDIFHTSRGGKISLFPNGAQKYDYSEILQSPAYQALAIGQALLESFIINFKHSKKKFLYIVTLTRTQDFNKPTVKSRKYLIIKETPIGGIIYQDRQGKLGYYAGDIFKSPIYKELAPGKKIFETFCITPQLCNLVVEITKPIATEDKPIINVIYQRR